MLEQLKLDHKPIYLQSVSTGNVLSTSMWPHPFSIFKKEKKKSTLLEKKLSYWPKILAYKHNLTVNNKFQYNMYYKLIKRIFTPVNTNISGIARPEINL